METKLETVLKNTISTIELIDDTYLHSFALKDDFRGKRFSRYVGKVKSELYEFVKQATPNFELIYKYKGFQTTNIADYFYANLVIYTHSLDDTFPYVKQLLHLFNIPEVPSVILDPKNLELIEDTLSQGEVIYSMIESELENVCQDYIAYMDGKNKDVNEINYIKMTLPLSNTDCLKLLNESFFKMIVSLEHLIMINNDYSTDLGKEIIDACKQLQFMNEENEQLKEKLQTETELVEKLKNTIHENEEKHRKLLNKTTEELRRENYELLKELDQLKEKRTINEKIEKEVIQEKIKEDVQEKINVQQLRLLFIISDRCTFLNELQAAFPNAKITFKNYQLSIPKYECVVVFTSYVNHTTYYHVKDICKQTNTPLLHCANSNIEKVKELLDEKINE